MSIDSIRALERRTLAFAQAVKSLVKSVQKTIPNVEFSKQLIRSSSSIGANYIEANESLGKKDFIMHVRISCKEARETIYWLNLIDCLDEQTRVDLIAECEQLVKIFGSMLRTSRAAGL